MAFGDTTGAIAAKLKMHDWLLVGIVVALLIGFAATFIAATAMLVDGFRDKKSSYQELSDEVKAQNVKIEELTDELRTLNEQKTIQTPN